MKIQVEQSHDKTLATSRGLTITTETIAAPAAEKALSTNPKLKSFMAFECRKASSLDEVFDDTETDETLPSKSTLVAANLKQN